MKLFEKGELKLLWPFYLSKFIKSTLIVWAVFYVIYFNQMGLSFFQISTFLAAYSFLGIIFEIPTGAIADIFGRKFSVVLGLILSSFLFIFMGLFKDYYILLGLWILLGIVTTLNSGADQALVIDHLSKNKRKDLVHDYYIKNGSIASFGGIFNGIIGAIIVKYFGLNIIWWITGIAILIGTSFIFFFIDENFKKQKTKIKEQLKETWTYSKFSIKYIFKNNVVMYIIIASFFLMLYGSLANMISWQPLLVSLGFKVYYLGYLISVGGLIAVFVPFFSKNLLKKFKTERNCLILLFLILFLINIMIFFAFNIEIAILIFYLEIIPIELNNPIRQKFFQHHIPDKYRASITSFKSMVMGIGLTIGSLIAGYLVDNIGPRMTIFYGAFFLIPTIISFYLIKK